MTINGQAGLRPGAGRHVAAAAAVAAAGAVAWALIAYATGDQFSFMAVLIGAAVGLTMRRAGGPDGRLQAAGALLAVAGCAAGTLLAMILLLNVRYHVGLTVIAGHLGTVLRAYPSAVGWLGLLFWVIAALEGARFQARRRRPARYGAAARPAPSWTTPGTPGTGGYGYGAPRPYAPALDIQRPGSGFDDGQGAAWHGPDQRG